MNKGRKIIALIPARGGSKGVPDKNIRDLAGKPLLAWTIEEAQRSKYIDRLVLSSDSRKIIDVAENFGCEAPFVRPSELAQDNSPGEVSLLHAIGIIPEKYDYAVLLQCTSPLRTVEDIDGAIDYCIGKDADSCVSVFKTGSNPYRMRTMDKNGRLNSFMPGDDKLSLPRQKLPEFYEFNGAIYVVNVKTFLETKRLVDERTLAYVMDAENSLDIDDLMDFAIVETMMKMRRGRE